MNKIFLISMLLLASLSKKHKTIDEDNVCLNEKCGVQINECFEDYECFEAISECAPQENPTVQEIKEAEQCVKKKSEAAEQLLECAQKKCSKKELNKKQMKLIKKFMNFV
ncbi:unnamed protein product [Paramecium pentaurelia]|uniref:Uncharacterized protein n=1 Tax=Paramecium pentaurelia TaxID=43138 RepID=A0A8S1Y4Y0_9CILI|nr:unnamed protein product [Paramecium pentaurelia]